jgi:hypothetical protein
MAAEADTYYFKYRDQKTTNESCSLGIVATKWVFLQGLVEETKGLFDALDRDRGLDKNLLKKDPGQSPGSFLGRLRKEGG